MFTDSMKEILNEEFNEAITENGAVVYATSGKNLLDINFAIGDMRNMDEKHIIEKFVKAFYEDQMLAVKWLFFARDVREGNGERRLFRVIMKWLAENHTDIALEVAELIPAYGRYDDLIDLMNCNNAEISNKVLELVKEQFNEDMKLCTEGKEISLLAKWLPSENASSQKTRALARVIIDYLSITPKFYRQCLSKLRAYLNVVETKMSAKEWDSISYPSVPSKANLIHNKAFLRNDRDRREAYLQHVADGTAKINVSVLFPHEIVNKYSCDDHWSTTVHEYDETLEQLWNNLKSIDGIENTLVVCDGSGSMSTKIDNNSSVSALEVSNALALYCGERCTGEFKDKFITFGSKPQLVDFSGAKTLHDKLQLSYSYDDCSNTNIEAMFDLILTTAVRSHMSQEDMPKNILIISDMNFDMATGSYAYNRSYAQPANEKLFKTIAKKYTKHGYNLPRLVFWNTASRGDKIPVRENECGVALVSGFSVNTLKMVMSNKLDPYECLCETLNSDRYKAVEDAILYTSKLY